VNAVPDADCLIVKFEMGYSRPEGVLGSLGRGAAAGITLRVGIHKQRMQ